MTLSEMLKSREIEKVDPDAKTGDSEAATAIGRANELLAIVKVKISR